MFVCGSMGKFASINNNYNEFCRGAKYGVRAIGANCINNDRQSAFNHNYKHDNHNKSIDSCSCMYKHANMVSGLQLEHYFIINNNNNYHYYSHRTAREKKTMCSFHFWSPRRTGNPFIANICYEFIRNQIKINSTCSGATAMNRCPEMRLVQIK